ncbi:MAG: PhzF family phenazine biosynthesis isomerase [Candidatus Pacebacteria bacterium]|nr:PhzF family phenazine biosynthesis isomerase [Candidatus Paceibacterota bacterium]
MKKEIPKAYNPQEVEDKIYKKWEESGKFDPDNLELPEDAEKFSISMPPPNATGFLHLGHASMLTYQDLMIRYNRMQGKKALWLPGTDHASIATQTKVEKIIAKEGKTKYDLGREKFLERINEYVENSKNTIKNQTRKMGSSCDWSRERYTLDDGLSRAVREVFTKMYNDGLIYRGDRIVNWCPRCESTLADDEVEHKDQKGKFYYFKYNKDFPITIATTRPETKLGDTAIAVNPKDKRYKKYIGQIFEIDLGNGTHKIKVIADRGIDMEFGTGAIGVTPAHSMIDWEIAEKNDLEKIKVIGEDGKMNVGAGKDYAGLTALKARKKFVKYLQKNDLIEKVEEVDQSLSICYRCDTPIEPLPSKQWFVAVDKKITIEGNKYFQNKSLKDVSLEVVRNREIKIIPERFEKTYYNWMENLHDWCISRQLWFGHRIPVYYKLKVDKVHKVESQEIYIGGKLPENDYKIANVFGSNISSGNIAGVVDKEFKENEMPEIAKEIGASESVFVLKSKNSNYDAEFRFFSKIGEETPLCGHALLAGATSFDKSDLKIKTLAGDIVVQKEDNKIFFQTDKSIRIKSNFSEELPFEFLGIEKEEFELLGIFSIGVPKLIVRIKDIETLRKVNPDFENLKKWNKEKNFSGYCLFVEDKKNKNLVFVRQFNPFLGINEDEATAVAAGALAAFFDNDFIVKQGTENFENEIYVRYKDDKILIGGNVFLKNSEWTQDFDTLDTWFSSGIWTFSTLLDQDHEKYKTFEEWVAGSPDLKKFHPTSVMETGYDILFFWIARMILMTTYTLDEVPFENVYLHGMVRDKQGKKMSKSLGNGIDPATMIEKYGTDALRLSMIIGSSPGNDIKMYEEKIEGYRNFVNKLWNVSRYIILSQKSKVKSQKSEIDYDNLTLADKWILEELDNLIYIVNNSLENYQFSSALEVGDGIRDFMWNKFADWYLEVSKVQEKNDAVLIYVLETLLKLCHPFIPFVTERIWEEMDKNSLLMVEKWPEDKKRCLELIQVNVDFDLLQGIISEIRRIKNENKISLKEKVDVVINSETRKDLTKADFDVIEKNKNIIEKLAGVKSLEFEVGVKKIEGWIHFDHKVSVYVNIGDLIDTEKEIEKTKKEIENIEKYITQIRKKLGNDNFVASAPREIVEKEREKHQESTIKLEKLKGKLELLDN